MPCEVENYDYRTAYKLICNYYTAVGINSKI